MGWLDRAGEVMEQSVTGNRAKAASEPRAAHLRRSGALAAMMAMLVATSTPARIDSARVAYVIDGDTFRLEGGERIRIANIDAPETQPGQAKCKAEIVREKAATRNARALLDGRTVGIERVGRSYNRTVARVTLDGRDLGETLIAMGIARPWPHYARKPNWCERPAR